MVRSRGRPRKRRRKEEENCTDDVKLGSDLKRQGIGIERVPLVLVGRYILKEFKGSGVFLGKVVYYECGLYRVHYVDGDYEDLDSSEIRGLLLDDCDFDDELVKKRNRLDQMVLKCKDKEKADVTTEDNDDDNGVVSSELPGEVLVGNDEEGGCSSSEERDCASDVENEASPLPPLLMLPPSSGNVGVPEAYVSHLLAVYGFLRSFSIRLFLSPFSLDEFVGSVNCQVPNTLFDSIHVSLLRALRRHLESLSSDGSENASKCLR